MRTFNTSGPNMPDQHYTLQRLDWIERGKNLVSKSRYFTIWAPRQTGKSTYFLDMVDGKTYIEAQTGVGRTDLLINVNQEEFVVEAKIYSDIVKFKRGKKQLAQYVKSLSLTSGIYLVFMESEISNDKVTEEPEIVEDILIKTYLVPYNLEADF